MLCKIRAENHTRACGVGRAIVARVCGVERVCPRRTRFTDITVQYLACALYKMAAKSFVIQSRCLYEKPFKWHDMLTRDARSDLYVQQRSWHPGILLPHKLKVHHIWLLQGRSIDAATPKGDAAIERVLLRITTHKCHGHICASCKDWYSITQATPCTATAAHFEPKINGNFCQNC